MGYCTIADLILRFGEREILQLSDRGDSTSPHFGTTNTARVQAAIDDACHEIDLKVSCCFDIKKIKTLLASSVGIPFLKKLNIDFARYRLYDSIKLQPQDGEYDHESYRRYRQGVKILEELCKCGTLIDDVGDVVPRISSAGIYVEEKARCMPKLNCDSCDEPCGCE